MATSDNFLPSERRVSLEPIDIKRELAKTARIANRFRQSSYFHPTRDDKEPQSSFFDQYTFSQNYYGNLKTADSVLNREVNCRTLRQVSKKAWIINLCITNVQKKIRPFLKPSTNRNLRGFVVKKIGEDVIKAAGQKSKERETIEQFLLNCGSEKSSDRDNFSRYCAKIIRDSLEIDYVATEICRTRLGEPYAFYAVDGATIEKVLPDQENPYNIKYVQLIRSMPVAYYPEGALIVDYQNPRSDIYRSFYGYSYVEQAIDLITSIINAFIYNAGFFTENKLPRGMLLIDGNASQETIEQMEDYLADIMSGSPSNQWRVPIMTSGNGEGGENNSIKWISLNGTNREMEFQGWLDFLTSGIVSLFGCSMEELGLHSSKSQPVFERNTAPEIEASKSLILGDMLSFLQQYLNQIIEKAFPGYEIEFVGYERDDPKQILELSKMEMESFKTVNEVRKEKGLKPLEAKWADSCPANPQLVQMYQSEQMNADEDGEMEDEEGADEESSGDFGEDTESDGGDDEAWSDIGNDSSEDEESSEEENADDEKSLKKSFNFAF